MSTKAYIAHALTGRSGVEVWNESFFVQQVLAERDIIALDPVIIEKIPLTELSIPIRLDAKGQEIWANDKKAIREAHVLIDLTPERKSEGVAHEIGYARYFLWKPVIRVYMPSSTAAMIASFEDDVIAYSIYEAADIINQRWGTRWKRTKWRIQMLLRSTIKFIRYQIQEFK